MLVSPLGEISFLTGCMTYRIFLYAYIWHCLAKKCETSCISSRFNATSYKVTAIASQTLPHALLSKCTLFSFSKGQRFRGEFLTVTLVFMERQRWWYCCTRYTAISVCGSLFVCFFLKKSRRKKTQKWCCCILFSALMPSSSISSISSSSPSSFYMLSFPFFFFLLILYIFC